MDEVMTLDDLGDEIMMLEGLDGRVGVQSVFSKIHEGYLPPIDPITVTTGVLFYSSLATAAFSSRFRAPALVMAAGAGILQVTRGILGVAEDA
jgi:hypothetical protein